METVNTVGGTEGPHFLRVTTSYFLIADVGAHASAELVETPVVACVEEEQERPFPCHGSPDGTDIERSSVAGHRYIHRQTRDALRQRTRHYIRSFCLVNLR